MPDLNEREQILLLECSIERVVNTTLKVLAKCPQHNEDVAINQEDWQDLKWLVVKLWNDARNELVKQREK